MQVDEFLRALDEALVKLAEAGVLSGQQERAVYARLYEALAACERCGAQLEGAQAHGRCYACARREQRENER